MHLVRAEDRERVDRLIAALPEAQRELLALRVAGELSAKEIGAVLGKSEGAVRVALYRTMQQLRAAYEQFETEDRQ
jgi:RNA polymerase sigma-70 factor (ECF subfamily)